MEIPPLNNLLYEQKLLIKKIAEGQKNLNGLLRRKSAVDRFIKVHLQREKKAAVVHQNYSPTLTNRQKVLFVVKKQRGQSTLDSVMREILKLDGKSYEADYNKYYMNICKTLSRLIEKQFIVKIEGKYKLL